ncbi:MAG TPA: hypothetical protein VIG68_03325, partial [Lysobacter sp.]
MPPQLRRPIRRALLVQALLLAVCSTAYAQDSGASQAERLDALERLVQQQHEQIEALRGALAEQERTVEALRGALPG